MAQVILLVNVISNCHQRLISPHARTLDIFRYDLDIKSCLDFDIVAFSFVFDNYCSIMD